MLNNVGPDGVDGVDGDPPGVGVALLLDLVHEDGDELVVILGKLLLDVEDDGDGFCFGAVITHNDGRLATVKYDYIGDIERWPLSLVRQWLEPDTTPLCEAMEQLLGR